MGAMVKSVVRERRFMLGPQGAMLDNTLFFYCRNNIMMFMEGGRYESLLLAAMNV